MLDLSNERARLAEELGGPWQELHTAVFALDPNGIGPPTKAYVETARLAELLKLFEQREGAGLISDDFGHWACAEAGIQNVPFDQRENPQDIQSTFFVDGPDWRGTIREALEYARENNWTERSDELVS